MDTLTRPAPCLGAPAAEKVEPMSDLPKFIVLAILILAPTFIMASKLSGDEFAKSAVGVALGAVVLGAWNLFQASWGTGDDKD